MLIDLATAKLHLRVDGTAEDDLIELWVAAAESAAANFLNRRIFESAEALGLAISEVPADLVAAGVAYDAATEAAALLPDSRAADAARSHASAVYSAARYAAGETYAGIVINEQITAAVLLTLGHLYQNREDVSVDPLTAGATALLQPFRVGLGV